MVAAIFQIRRFGQDWFRPLSNVTAVVELRETPEGHVDILKVSSRSSPNAVAGAMAGVVRRTGLVEVQVVGAGSLNQAIKALAIARGYMAPVGLDLVCVPTFADIEIDGERRTAIRLRIEDRERRLPDQDLVALGSFEAPTEVLAAD